MTNDEKLQHIYNVAIKDADRQRRGILEAYQEGLDKEYQRHVSEKQQRIQNETEERSALIQRELNKKFSAESLEIKHSLSLKRKELLDFLFNEVKEKLLAFKKTPDYVPYLVKLIKKAETFAGNDPMTVYIDKSDQGLSEEIEKLSGIKPETGRENILGGIQARIESRHILIDRSWKRAIEEQKENYSLEGGSLE